MSLHSALGVKTQWYWMTHVWLLLAWYISFYCTIGYINVADTQLDILIQGNLISLHFYISAVLKLFVIIIGMISKHSRRYACPNSNMLMILNAELYLSGVGINLLESRRIGMTQKKLTLGVDFNLHFYVSVFYSFLYWSSLDFGIDLEIMSDMKRRVKYSLKFAGWTGDGDVSLWTNLPGLI